MSSFATILVLLGFLWILAGIALLLHRLYPRTGLTPLMMYLGAIAAVMQVQGLRAIEFSVRDYCFNLDGAVLLPVLLFGLLIVYITNGSVRGRSAALGVMLISVLEIGFQALLYILPEISNIEFIFLQTYSLRIIAASVVTLAVDIIVLFLGYQSFSNLRHRYPSRFASGLALMLALLVDAVIFSLLAFGGSGDRVIIIQSQILEKLIAGLALWPLLAVYIYRVVPQLPDSAATSSRPILDIFTTNLQLESRARYHYSLLRTLSQINQLIVRSMDADTLLQQACEALVELRKYHMVWIGAIKEESGEISFAAQAGLPSEQAAKYNHSDAIGLLHPGLLGEHPVIVNDIASQKNYNDSWRKMMLAMGCRSAASFPMYYAERKLGILNVGMDRPNSLEEIEIELLQELAGDLAYALVSLEARGQQAILQTAAETMQDGLLIADPSGEIVFANSIVARVTGKSPQEMIGKKISSLLLPELHAGLPGFLENLTQMKFISVEFDHRTFDHRELAIAVNASLVSNQPGQSQYMVATIRDNTRWRKYERQLLALNHLTGELVQIHDSQTLMKRILEMSEELLEADASGIYFVDSATRKITDTLTHNLAAEYAQRIAQDYQGLPGETVSKTLQPVFVNDTLNDIEYGERILFMAEFKIRALLILPILFQGQPMGALTVYYPQPHEFGESQLQLGLTLAQTLAIVIQNAHLYHAEQEQSELAEALARAAAAVSSSLELDDVLDHILEQTMRVIPCQAVNIMTIEGEQVILSRHRGYEDFIADTSVLDSMEFPMTWPGLQEMYSEGIPIFMADTYADDRWQRTQDADWVRSFIGIPLKVDQQIVGFLNLDSDQPGLLNKDFLPPLQTFADYASTAIKNARLYNAELNQRELAEALAQAAASVSSSLELEDVLDHILEQTLRVAPGQAANIMMIDDNNTRIIRHRGYEKYIADTSVIRNLEPDTTWPVFQKMYTQESPVLIADTSADPRWTRLPETQWVRSYVGIPLKVDQQVVGFLNIDSDQPNFLTEQFLPRLQTFADYASTAIKNARAYESSRQRAEEMAALVAAASAVSKSLDYMQVLQVVAEQMTKTLRIQTCVIASYDSELNSVTYLVKHSPQKTSISSKWDQPISLADHPATRSVLENNTPFQIQIDNPDLSPIQRKFMADANASALLLLPLITQDRTIGLVVLTDDDKDRIFTVREIALGLSVAAHAATALENARLYQQLQEHALKLEERVQIRTLELQEATEYIEGILASVPEAVFVLDQKHQLLRANQAGERLLAHAQAIELDLFNPKLLKILETGGVPDIQSILEVQGKAYQALSSQWVADDDQPGGQIIVFRDVTRFRELDQMKTQFVSDVSHELRTPLTNLTLYLGLLTTVRDSDKQDEYIQTLQRETERLTHLIEDLLTISRLEASKIQFQIRATDINQLVEDLVCDRAFLAAQKSIELDFTPAPDLPLASADENMLTQALSNLLTNATNYTQPGGYVHVYAAQPEPEWITIQISDTGVGIPADETEHIFNRFYRGSASQYTGAEGTGLGLSISQEIIQRLGGKITIKTTPGKGSTFTIWLKPAPDGMLQRTA